MQNDVEVKFRALDSRLAELRNRRKVAEVELAKINREDTRLCRIYVEADQREKLEIRTRVDAIVGQRTDLERDMAGLATAIIEAEQERTALLPEFEALWVKRRAKQVKDKLEDLRRAHEQDQLKVRDCEKALQLAMEAELRSHFAWTSFKDQLAADERAAALEVLKAEWAKTAGPNAQIRR